MDLTIPVNIDGRKVTEAVRRVARARKRVHARAARRPEADTIFLAVIVSS